jgi:hypothetical protein
MSKFTVEAQEVVFYTFEIEADSLEQAKAKISIGDYDTGPAVDGTNFEITNIQEELTV